MGDDFNDWAQGMSDEEIKSAIEDLQPTALNDKSKNNNSIPHRRRLQPYAWHELDDQQPRDYLVKHLLDRRAMSVVYGESGCGKTFLVLDLALHAGQQRCWFGLRTKRAAVLYVAAEGGTGIRRRLNAFVKAQGIDPTQVEFHVLPTAPDLCDPKADIEELIEEIQHITPTIGLVILDTLSRVIAGGNENSPDDMGALVRNCDRIRAETGAHVMLVHHTGKDTAKGARGHSLLRAATDTEIEIKRNSKSKTITAKVTKQRDGETGKTFAFRLETVELGVDPDGDPITSCFVVPEAQPPVFDKRQKKIRGHKGVALQCLRRLIDEHGEVPPPSNHMPQTGQKCVVRTEAWREYFIQSSPVNSDKPDSHTHAFNKAVRDLQADDLVRIFDGWAWPTW